MKSRNDYDPTKPYELDGERYQALSRIHPRRTPPKVYIVNAGALAAMDKALRRRARIARWKERWQNFCLWFSRRAR